MDSADSPENTLRSGDETAWDELRSSGPRLVESLRLLRKLAADSDPEIRTLAIETMERLRAEAAPALPELKRALLTGPNPVRAAAADTLSAIGASALRLLRHALDESEMDTRLFACRGLGSIGPTAAGAVPDLVERLEDGDEQMPVRLRAAWALGEIGTDQGVASMANVFREEGAELGLRIAEALAKLGRQGRAGAGALRDALHRDDDELAIAAAKALLSLRRNEEQAIWTLIRWLQEGDEDAAAEAALILGDCGSKAVAAIPALRSLEQHDDDEMRNLASMAIAKIRPEYAASR